MSSRLALIVLVIAATPACLFITDPGELVSETRAVPEFDAIDVFGGIHVKVRIGEHKEARIFGRERAVELLTFKETAGRLEVGLDSGTMLFANSDIEIELTTPVLTGITASGGSVVEIEGPVVATRFNAEISGGGLLNVASLDAAVTQLNASGGSVVEVVGQTDTLGVEASGGSTYDLAGLTARTVQLEASGGSSLSIYATEQVRGSASGGSVIDIFGDPVSVGVDASSDVRITRQ